jgi:hypothetical protein
MKKNQPKSPKPTKLIHVDPATHLKFKRFCISNNKTMQTLAEKALREFMKSPEII